MKRALKNLLIRKKLYYTLKYSRLFRFYQLLLNRTEINQQKKEVNFYRSFLPACRLIFDIGANDGHKTEAFLELSEKVVSCEPDPENFKILQARFKKNKKRVVLENKALSEKEGLVHLHIHHPGSAFNTISNKWVQLLEKDNNQRWNESIKFSGEQTVEATTIDQLIAKYGAPDFIKIDAEGAEEWIINGLTQRVPYLSFEMLLPEYKKEMESCLAHLNYLDSNAMYNLSRFEELVLPEFVSLPVLEDYLRNSNLLSFDIVVKMTV